jgi:benzylsuccinate CoA-transferase BbsF subunit
MALPLEGVRIVEMGQLIAIPYAIKLLSDMGAQIIRIESCVRLENYRANSFYDDNGDGEYWNRGVNFYEQNRNKLGVALDLTKARGREALIDLIALSDVFAENFTPRVVRNFGLEYGDLRAVKPDIIMVSSTGYGHTGPWSGFGAIGYGTEAASGLAHITGYRGGPPMLPEIPYADYTAAEHTVFAIAAALVHRARSGEGQFIDLSQTETLSSTVPEAFMDFAANSRVAERIGNGDHAFAPQGCYRCKGDDAWIAISAATDAQWSGLCEALGKPDWVSDAMFADSLSRWRHRQELDNLIGLETSAWDHRELERGLQARKVPAGAVLDGRELLFDPHLNERGFFEVVEHHPSTGMPPLPYSSRPWRFSETPGRIERAAPLLGQHNRWALAEVLGMSAAGVAAMEEEGVIGTVPVNAVPPAVARPDALLRQGRIVRREADFKEQVRSFFTGR